MVEELKLSILNLKGKLMFNTWWIVFLLFPMIAPSEQAIKWLVGGTIGGLFFLLIRLWNIASIGIIILLMLMEHKKLNPPSIMILVFCAILTISTLVHKDASAVYMIRVLGSLISLFLLSCLYDGNKFIHYLQALYYYLSIISVLAAITIFLFYPTGMDIENHYLYGLDNVSFIFALHGFAMGFIYCLVKYKRLAKSFIILYAFIGSAYIYTRTGTGTAIIAMCIVFALIYKKKIMKLMDYRIALLLCVFIYFYFTTIQNFGPVENIFRALGKDSTLNGRVRIWEVGTIVIKQNLILGIGVTDSLVNEYLHKAGLTWTVPIGHLHNVVLELLLKGGIVTLGIFIAMWSGCLRQMIKFKKHIIAISLSAFVVLSWFACMFEFRIIIYSFWLLLILMYHISNLISLYDNDQR